MTLSLLIVFILTFLFGYTVTHYSLTTWGVRTPITVVVGCLFGVLCAVFATLAVAPITAL